MSWEGEDGGIAETLPSNPQESGDGAGVEVSLWGAMASLPWKCSGLGLGMAGDFFPTLPVPTILSRQTPHKQQGSLLSYTITQPMLSYLHVHPKKRMPSMPLVPQILMDMFLL